MAYRSSATATSTTGGSLTATPSGIATGDTVIAGVQEALAGTTGVTTVSTPSGWTICADVGGGNGGGGSVGARLWIVNSYNSETTTFTASGADQTVLIVAAWTGRDTTKPVYWLSATRFTTQQATPITLALTDAVHRPGHDAAVFVWVDQNTGADRWSSSAISGYTQRQNTFSIDWVSMFGLQTIDSSGATGTTPITTTITRTSGADTAGRAAVSISLADAPKTYSVGWLKR